MAFRWTARTDQKGPFWENYPNSRMRGPGNRTLPPITHMLLASRAGLSQCAPFTPLLTKGSFFTFRNEPLPGQLLRLLRLKIAHTIVVGWSDSHLPKLPGHREGPKGILGHVAALDHPPPRVGQTFPAALCTMVMRAMTYSTPTVSDPGVLKPSLPHSPGLSLPTVHW